ncbi:hypothetical protein SE17_33630, partial [Kouleothrix aurantiaca]
MNDRFVQRFALPLLLLVMLAALPAGAGAATPASPAPSLPAGRAARENTLRVLQAHTAAPLNIHTNPATGAADFLAAADAHVPLAYAPTPAEAGNPEATARGFLNAYRALFGLRSAQSELTLVRIEADKQLGYSHVRLGQVYQGVPVFGKQLIVHVDPQGRVASVNGQFFPGIDLKTQPVVGVEAAEQVALRYIPGELDENERANVRLNPRHDRTRLMIYVEPNGTPRLTWSVSVATARPLGQWQVFVNANRARVVHGIDSLANAKRRVTFSADNTTELPGRQLIDEGERSRDPVAQAAHGRKVASDCLEMAAIAFGGMDEVRREPVFAAIVNANSPLRWDTSMIGGVLTYARGGQPLVVTPFILAGAMSPITMAAAVAQQNAEALAGIALAQIVNPGVPIIYGGFTTNTD